MIKGGSTPSVSVRELIKNSVRMRPDRVIIGDCNGEEALDIIQVMNCGLGGFLMAMHGESPANALDRMETQAMMTGVPQLSIRKQLAGGAQIVVQMLQMPDGSRKMVSISEVQGLQEGHLVLQELWKYEQTAVGEQGKNIGKIIGNGVIPKCHQKFLDAGIALDPEVYSSVLHINNPEFP